MASMESFILECTFGFVPPCLHLLPNLWLLMCINAANWAADVVCDMLTVSVSFVVAQNDIKWWWKWWTAQNRTRWRTDVPPPCAQRCITWRTDPTVRMARMCQLSVKRRSAHASTGRWDFHIWAHCADIMSYFAHHFDMAAHHCVEIFDTDTHNTSVTA